MLGKMFSSGIDEILFKLMLSTNETPCPLP